MTTDALPPAITYEHKVATIAAVLLAETGGEYNSMCAVAQVIRNRGSDPYAVVTKRKQFSCLNGITTLSLIRKWKTDVRGVNLDARYIAEKLVNYPNDHHDLRIAKATHYHAVKITPYWAKGKKPIAVIGGHKFYKLP